MKKRIASLLAAALMCTLLCACRTESTDPPGPESKPSAAVAGESELPESEPVEEEETAGPEQSAAPIPVTIETSGGVVVVGTIGCDEKGWHIIPEQPLDITYTYFIEQPSVFPGQTRINMVDSGDDGVDKAVYLGQTVTVYGEFRFVRDDFETLYLAPYTIAVGKIAEGSYGDPELMAPEGPVDLYDRSIPLPERMEPHRAADGYRYNAFMLSEESLQFMGNDFANFYCDFVDAVLNYRSEVFCPEKLYAEMLGTVIYYDFPIFDACAQPFEFFKHYDSEANMIRIEYKYGREEHDTLLGRFQKAADEMLATVKPDMDEVEKAKKIYHEICTRMVYDDSALEDFERKNSYYAYLHSSGVCITFANVYNQLLTQVGIKTTLASCDYDATMGHAWSVVTLNGQDYFCDPTFELSHNSGNGYIYFGMNYADRTKNGLGKNGIRMGRYYSVSAVLPEMIAEQSLPQ